MSRPPAAAALLGPWFCRPSRHSNASAPRAFALLLAARGAPDQASAIKQTIEPTTAAVHAVETATGAGETALTASSKLQIPKRPPTCPAVLPGNSPTQVDAEAHSCHPVSGHICLAMQAQRRLLKSCNGGGRRDAGISCACCPD